MSELTLSEKKSLIHEYYHWTGEDIKSIKRITAIVYKGTQAEHETEVFRVKLKSDVSTLCVIAYDAHAKPYATEIDSSQTEREDKMISNWRYSIALDNA